MNALVPRPLRGIDPAVPRHLQRRLIWISDEALRNGVHVMGGPGSGKSRLMGRLIGWLMFLRRLPTVILDPTGGTIDNFLSKIIQLPKPLQRACWTRVQYVDMGATDYVVPWPLYYRMHEQETLFAIAQRYLEVVRRIDPYLQTASVEGWNALAEIGTYTGMVLSALDLQITEALDLIRHPQGWKERFERALATYPEVAPAVRFFRSFQQDKRELQLRRSRAFVNKLLPFTTDPGMQAMFGGRRPGVDWQEVVQSGRTVLLDFRSELNLERRRFKMLWCYSSLVEYLKLRGVAGREQPLCLLIDEVTQLLGFRTLEHSILAEDLEELVSVIARNYGVYLCIAHQSLAQLDERIRNILMQMGTQIIGVTPNPDDALYLARQFFQYDPRWVKKTEPVWMNVSDPIWPMFSAPQVIDRRTVEYTPEEQLLLTADEFRKLGRFRFLVRVARGEGQIAGTLRRMSIEELDRNQYPDDALTSQARNLLRRRDGVPVEQILADIRLRRTAGKQSKPAPAPLVTMDDDAHHIQTPSPEFQPQIQEEDEDEIILREEA